MVLIDAAKMKKRPSICRATFFVLNLSHRPLTILMNIVVTIFLSSFFSMLIAVPLAQAGSLDSFFAEQGLGKQDSILLTQVDVNGRAQTLFEWQADTPLIPASLMKLATSYLAMKKWGLDKRFETHFFRHGHTLWVKGFGDPYLISEEIDIIVSLLAKSNTSWIRAVAIDGSYFKSQSVPGRSQVADPYNAPLAAVSANFNTAKLQKRGGQFFSAEPQTPLTNSAVKVAILQGLLSNGKSQRINLINADNAKRNVAEILIAKLAIDEAEIKINDATPSDARLLFTHANTRTLADILRGTLEFSNNFMANQLFLMLVGNARADFSQASSLSHAQFNADFAWSNFSIVEGAGLSKKNRLSSRQINDLLSALKPVKNLFKRYSLGDQRAEVFAKTGSLNGVHSFAGYISTEGKEYQFVFNFNRKVSYKYREKLLNKLLFQL